jgi:hypothetical protein
VANRHDERANRFRSNPWRGRDLEHDADEMVLLRRINFEVDFVKWRHHSRYR